MLDQLLSMFPTDVAIGRTADVDEKAGVSLLVSETDVRSVGFDLPCSGDGGIPHHYDVIHLHKPIICVVMPLHEWATGSFPPAGRPPTRQVGPSRVHVSVQSTRRTMTSEIDIDCRHYNDRELGTAPSVDINDHQESTERHRQLAVRQTTETPQRLKQVFGS